MLNRDGLMAGTKLRHISAADQASMIMGGRQVFAAAFGSIIASSMRAPD